MDMNRNNRNNNDSLPTAFISFHFSGTGKLGSTLIVILALLAVLGFATNRYFGIEELMRDYKHVENITQVSENIRFIEEIYPEKVSYFVDDLRKNCFAADTERAVTFSNPLTNTKRIYNKFIY